MESDGFNFCGIVPVKVEFIALQKIYVFRSYQFKRLELLRSYSVPFVLIPYSCTSMTFDINTAAKDDKNRPIERLINDD